MKSFSCERKRVEEPEQREPLEGWLQTSKNRKHVKNLANGEEPKYIEEMGLPVFRWREVIPPTIKELPDCEGLWMKKGGLPIYVSKNSTGDFLGALGSPFDPEHSSGEWVYLDPYIKQIWEDAE